MKLAVMMAAFNATPYIGDALASILTQEHGAELDIIVINDGSTDKTGQVVADLAKEAPQIRMIETANQGVTRARNEALTALAPDTDFVTFLDADDLVPAGRYARDLALFAATPELQLIYGTTQLFRVVGPDRLSPAANTPTANVRGVQLAAGMYRHGLIKSTGAFDTQFKQAEDMDFLLRMFESGPCYQVREDTCLFYRRHETNMTHDAAQLRRDFSRALLLSIQRRRKGNLPPFPAGLFDTRDVAGKSEW